jgi:UDP-N-acetylmuramate dehydrogenase
MSAARKHETGLLDRLPEVRGEMIANEPLDRFTWFRVGGPAEVLFHPADRDDLAAFLAAKPADIPVTVVGGASNLLIRDGGIEGVVVKLGRGFRDVEIGAVFEEVDFEPVNGGTDYVLVNAGAGAANIQVARACRDAGLGSAGDIAVAGLEFLSGIPGTIGGALRMNAGAYGGEMAEVVVHAKALDPAGELHRVPLAKLGYSYRHCALPQDWIFTGAALRGVRAPGDVVASEIERIANAREESQPLRTRTGGSTFKNPEDKRAWELIDEAGCRGLRRGAAMVSEKHCNFLINTGEASAADLEDLGDEVRARVKEATGVALVWEIRRIGLRADGRPEDAT